MSTTERVPARPADEAEARGPSPYASTIAALEAALAEPLPVDGEAAALSTAEG